MSNGLIVTINQQNVFQFNGTRLPARVRRHVEEIDEKLDQGFELSEQWLDKPDVFQKQQYAAMILLDALDRENHSLVELMAAFLVTRNTKLKEVRATADENHFNFSLIFD